MGLRKSMRDRKTVGIRTARNASAIGNMRVVERDEVVVVVASEQGVSQSLLAAVTARVLSV